MPFDEEFECNTRQQKGNIGNVKNKHEGSRWGKGWADWGSRESSQKF